jgi:hypothetical protein
MLNCIEVELASRRFEWNTARAKRPSIHSAGRNKHAMFTIRALLACVLTTGHLVPEAALGAHKWFLLARHGECFPIRSLERKFPDLGNISDPESFMQFVRAKGLKVSSKAMPGQAGSAVEVLVPEKELALVFVSVELCSRVETR